jgi:hypothetical protein
MNHSWTNRSDGLLVLLQEFVDFVSKMTFTIAIDENDGMMV